VDGRVTQTNYSSPKAPVHVVIGSAGNIEGPTKEWFAPPSWLAYRNYKDFGYGMLNVHNASTLSWEYRRATDNSVADTFTLTK
jgi:hypothetical protein